jgi:SAM-dependent methyltransferase
VALETNASERAEAWERAYLRFETPEKELRKFGARLRRLGAAAWRRDSRVVEAFCGRGSGLVALSQAGFNRLTGVDLSPRLLARYSGPARVLAADCLRLPLATGTQDVVIVQGGLHHLPTLPTDLLTFLDEVTRVLRPGGRFAAVEPWDTPFLRVVHAACGVPLARRLWRRLDSLAEMIEWERPAYHDWLAAGPDVLAELRRRFPVERCVTRLGKLEFVGRRPRASR